MKKIVFLISITTIFSCSSPNNSEESIEDKNDRESMLIDITNNIIVPSHENLLISLNDLKLALDLFISDFSQQNMSNLRKEWKNAYAAWQYVELYNIGKAEEISYNKRSNTYPVNTTILNNNIQSQSYDLTLDNFSSYSSQGFPAIDYMIYGIDIDTNNIINYYNVSNSDHLMYLQDLINELINNTNEVVNYWNTEKSSFVSRNGNSATSSLNLLINDFIYYYEKGFRANKIGIPAGVYSNTPLIQNVEARYCQYYSKFLAHHGLNSARKFFTGESFDGSIVGKSLDWYLFKLDPTNQILIDRINEKFENSEQMISQLDPNFQNQINNNNIKMLQTFDAIQEAVPLLKIDMLASLNINIDYVDADGD
tara:strand:- start:213 stop:1313 length:1101 start_codon:yes stop_codon:yes gene_type:complete